MELKGHEDGDLTSDAPFTMLFGAEGKIKHAMADDFDDSRYITGYLYSKDNVSRTNAQVMDTLSEQGQMERAQSITVEEQMQNAGVSANAFWYWSNIKVKPQAAVNKVLFGARLT